MNEILDFSNYTICVAIIQIIVAFVIYFITNWLGGYTPSDRGYMSLSLVIKEDTMPAFNFVFKTLTPIVLYILFVALCQNVDSLHMLLNNNYLVIVYYWGWRIMYYVIHGVLRLVDWKTTAFYMAVTIGVAMLIYRHLGKVQTILPDLKTLRDQMWILMAIFIYQLLNKLQIDRDGSEQRKRKYILRMYAKLREQYGEIISSQCHNRVDEGLVYSIMIMENYNRPPVIRVVEYARFLLKRKKMSLGIMQVKTRQWISDRQSVHMGMEMIINLRQEYFKKVRPYKRNDFQKKLSSLVTYVANEYNGCGDDYANEVETIFSIINEDVFPHLWEVNIYDALRLPNAQYV